MQRVLLVRTTFLSQYQPCHGDVSRHNDTQCYLSLWNTWFSHEKVTCPGTCVEGVAGEMQELIWLCFLEWREESSWHQGKGPMYELLGKLRHVVNESSVCNECTLSNDATGPSPEHHAGTLQLIPCESIVTKDEVYNWYACDESTMQPWRDYNGLLAITVSKMSFSACEWGEYPSNYVALSEFPAEVMHDVFHGNWTTVRPSSNFGLSKSSLCVAASMVV